MKRVKDINGIVHFSGNDTCALCSAFDKNLLGEHVAMKDTDNQVDCPECTRIYCEIRNTPLNAVADNAYDTYWTSLADEKFGKEEV